MASFVLTAPMAAVMFPQLHYQIGRALGAFPELGDRKVTVGLTTTPGIDGLAVADEMLVRLNVNRRRVPYFTIGHELMHLLQRPGLGVVPAGEVQCDIWTLARSELFLDEKPCYLEVACGKREWPRHAHTVRRLCRDALDVRRRDRRYIVWLKHQLRAHFEAPAPRPLFDALPVTPFGSSSSAAQADMSDLKRATVYFDPSLHKALRLKAAETEHSVSDLVNAAVRRTFAEDADDLAAFEERAGEKNLAFEDVLKDLKRRGKL